MTGMVSIHQPTDDSPEPTIQNDGWWPDISAEHARQVERLTETITSDRLNYAIVNAVLTVNDELKEWRTAQEEAGHTSLASVPSSTINGESRLTALYIRAVYGLAHADLLERYPDYSATLQAQARAEIKVKAADDHYRSARWAINDLAGRSRSTVELI